jgi:hypothetical protein
VEPVIGDRADRADEADQADAADKANGADGADGADQGGPPSDRISFRYTQGGVMGKKEDAMIAKLVKKANAKVAPPKDRTRQYDDTLKIRPTEEDADSKQLFKEMKRREF